MIGSLQTGLQSIERHWRACGLGRDFIPTAILAGALAFGGPAWAQDPELPAEYDKPTRHFEIDRPAELTDAAALTRPLRRPFSPSSRRTTQSSTPRRSSSA